MTSNRPRSVSRPYILRTPLLNSPLLDQELGFRLFVKAECLQPAGAFKVRGAFNQILQLSDEEKRAGIMAVSSGNHAQAVAYAAKKFGVAAAILMPHDAPSLKMDNTRAYGAEVITYDRNTGDREKIAKDLAQERKLRLIHPYNDPRTIAGQGTSGLEIFEQTKEMGITPDAILVNCSGGGLASGIALTRELYKTPPQIYTTEPRLFNDMQRSLDSGTPATNDKLTGSICDALLAPTPGGNTLPILLHHKAKGLSATDEEVEAAMNIAAVHFKLVLEPGGAVGLACACLNRQKFKGKTVVVVASGGNADPAEYPRMLERGQKNSGQLSGALAA